MSNLLLFEYPKVKSRNLGVDLARTFAIVGVLLIHTTGLWFGRFGVQLFFMISGYLLADFEIRQTRSMFLIHRFFRLFPLSIIFIVTFYLNTSNQLDLTFNLLLISTLWWGITPLFPGLWSISSEWVFSLMLVLVGNFSKKKTYILIFVSALGSLVFELVVIYMGGADISAGAEQYEFRSWLNTTNPIVTFGFFAIGIGIKKNYINFNRVNKYLAILLFLLIIIEDKMIGNFVAGWMLALSLFFTLCLNFESRMKHFNFAIGYIGKRTYGIFFVHFLLLDNIYLSQVYNWLQISPDSFFYKILNFLVVFSLSILGGTLTYIIIEKPFLVFSKRAEMYFKKKDL